MRNGNKKNEFIAFRLNPFLSYLWGMETLVKVIWHLWNNPFYPTYEEWKRYEKVLELRKILPFYPTYEEWKLTFILSSKYIFSLFILPMRNGNEKIENSKCDEEILFILPMRNGNFHMMKRLKDLNIWLFILPMRNGNSDCFKNAWKFWCFLSYLWGMETY